MGRWPSLLLVTVLCVACSSEPSGLAWSTRELGTPAAAGSSAPWLDASPGASPSLTWLEPVDGGGHALCFALLGADGWGERHEIARSESWFVNWADTPRQAALADGTRLVTWLDGLGQGTYAYGVRFALSSDDGSTWSEPRWLHDDRSPVEHGFVSLVAEEDSFRALWLDGRGYAGAGSSESEGSMQLRTRTLAADGTLGQDTLLDERVCDCCPTTMVQSREPHATGTNFVSHAAFRDRSAEEVRDVQLASLSEPSGYQELGTHGEGWQIDGCPVNGPVLTLRGQQMALVDFSADGDRARIHAESLSYTKMEGWWRSEPVELPASEPFGSVAAAFDAQGRLWVSWLESRSEGMQGVWRVAHTGPTRGPVAAAPGGEAFSAPRDLAIAPAARAAGIARLVPSGDGLLFAWTSGGTDGGVRSVRIEIPVD